MAKYIPRTDMLFGDITQSNTSKLSEHPIVCYCNWSFDKNAHISESELAEALRQFNNKYIPYYVRLFNETPSALFQEFVNSNNISEDEIEAIYLNITKTSNRKISRDFFKVNQNKEE